MTRLTDAQNFLDVNGLNSVRQQSKSTDKTEKEAALQSAAKQFEAIFMQMLLKSMRSAQEVLESDSPFNSESTKFYRDMHDQQMSLELSNNGSLGLSELIVRQLGGDSENFTPHTVLRGNGNLDSRGKNVFDLHNTREPLSKTIELDRQTNDNNTANIPKYLSKDGAKNINENTQLLPEFKNPQDFVTAITDSAKQVEARLKIPFEVVIAQAALETGWGQKIIKTNQGESSNNLFNIKADSRWQGDKTSTETLEFQQGAMVKKREPFRVYSSIAESVNDYVNFLSTNERYQPALEHSSNVEQFLHKLQSAGYATDPNYANKILGTLKTVTGLIGK
ncbi:flagellar assembly peptidoglycan hydrolase FlgJ [Pseudocolwellia agarivorans]|uniref:flagellar assembly peptidoglycan hydrolase FlgJ n=1 Tax=Pseudocolwellia agarivorans TaxID=1911682 RepID=UPI0009861769|nr:flagellar assembly peptidoglycan hydrolase FlgJ [Pseudocolwellia agarivorans]